MPEIARLEDLERWLSIPAECRAGVEANLAVLAHHAAILLAASGDGPADPS